MIHSNDDVSSLPSRFSLETDPKLEVASSVGMRKLDGNRKLILIPTPSGHPRDPLNWPSSKKYLTLAIVCFAAWAAATTPFAHLTSYVFIAETYHHAPAEGIYTIAAAAAGLLGGSFLLAPLVKLNGRTAVIFWCLLGTMATQIWSARLTSSKDDISFTISRALCGIFASVPTVAGGGYIMDIFFLHQRGFAFVSYELALAMGIIVSYTIGGFIVQSHPWPFVFWWTLGPVALAAALFGLVIEETEYAPGRSQDFTASHSTSSYFIRRMQCLTGYHLVPRINLRQLLHHYGTPFIIGVAPVTVLAGFYIMVNYGWIILVYTELTIFLKTPTVEGGYGFSPTQNTTFTFTAWLAVIIAQGFGVVYVDRVPIRLSLRRKGSEHGIWHLEDRLWAMLLCPAILAPIGLGIVGATLQYHLHFLLLALGSFLTLFSVLLSTSICMTYVVETFPASPVEVGITMATYRLALGLGLLFFFVPWQETVGVGWVFGMMAFFSVFAMGAVGLLALFGRRLRRLVLHGRFGGSEDGQKLSID